MRITKGAYADVDMGILVVRLFLSVIPEGQGFPPNLILLGSNSLKALKIVTDFDKKEMLLFGTYPVPMFTNDTSIQEHVENIKEAYVSLSAIKVKFDTAIVIPAKVTKQIEIKVSPLQAIALSDTHSF